MDAYPSAYVRCYCIEEKSIENMLYLLFLYIYSI